MIAPRIADSGPGRFPDGGRRRTWVGGAVILLLLPLAATLPCGVWAYSVRSAIRRHDAAAASLPLGSSETLVRRAHFGLEPRTLRLGQRYTVVGTSRTDDEVSALNDRIDKQLAYGVGGGIVAAVWVYSFDSGDRLVDVTRLD